MNIIINELQKMKSPFLIVTTSPLNNQYTTIVLTCEQTSLQYDNGKLNQTYQKGWLRVLKHRFLTNEPYYDYEKVEYYLCSQKAYAQFSVSYSLVNAKTQQVLKTNAYSQRNEDAIEYAYYKGEGRNLFPGYWNSKSYSFFSNEDKEDYINHNGYAELQLLLNARQKVNSSEELLGKPIQYVFNSICNDVRNVFFP